MSKITIDGLWPGLALYNCAHMATVGVKGLISVSYFTVVNIYNMKE